MKNRSLLLLTLPIFYLTISSGVAQPVVRTLVSSVRFERRITEQTKIIDKDTGQPVSFRAYQQLINSDPYGYHLEPLIDEYGQATMYAIRPTTADERATHRFKDRSPDQQPKAGKPMPEFIMKGLDDKLYRLTELKGHVVVLSFWVGLNKPFWNENQARKLADVLRPYQAADGLISLGVLNESREAVASAVTAGPLPFIPIPDGHGFEQKFHIITTPSFVVIDRAGNVAAFIDRADTDQLQSVLQTVSR